MGLVEIDVVPEGEFGLHINIMSPDLAALTEGLSFLEVFLRGQAVIAQGDGWIEPNFASGTLRVGHKWVSTDNLATRQRIDRWRQLLVQHTDSMIATAPVGTITAITVTLTVTAAAE
jgi:hypothetical protein